MTPTQRGDLAAGLVPIASELAYLVREFDRTTITEFLDALTSQQRQALPVVLAAMVPDDRTPSQLLTWVTWDEHGQPLTSTTPTRPAPRPVPQLQPCGTHAAYTRHKNRGETPCHDCRQAERAYQRARKRSSGITAA